MKKLLLTIGFFLISSPAWASLAIDGSVTSITGTGNNQVGVLSTTSSNDVIIIWAYSASTPGVVSISDTAGLSWAIRGTSHSWNAGAWRAEEWYAIAPSPLSSDSITVTYSGSPGRMIAFGISGANTVTPFDPNASLQAFTQSTGSSASVTVTTNNANDMLISTVRINGSIGTATEPSGFTNLISAGGAQDASYKIVSSTLSSSTETYSWSGGSTQYAMMFDAIQAASNSSTNFNSQGLIFRSFP